MIERQFVLQKIKEYQIQEMMSKELAKAGYSHTEIKRTPLGEKIIVYTTRPGLVVGKKGENIRRLTNILKNRFKMENPQIEIGEIENPFLDAQFVSDKIASTLERFGSKRFKSTGYKVLQDIMDAGALGAEIVISGKVPSARARSWRFSAGYLKKSGDISQNQIKKSYSVANLTAGIVGIKVHIMTPDIKFPDRFNIYPPKDVKLEELKEAKEEKKVPEEKTELKKETKEKSEEKSEEKAEEKPKKRTRKRKTSVDKSAEKQSAEEEKIEDGNNKKE